jgi:hypothetical protein
MLDELAERATLLSKGAPLRSANVTVHLHSGSVLSGEVLEVTRDGGVPTLSLRLAARPEDSAFVPVGSIEALVVHDLAALDKRVPSEPAPSKLELRRAAASASERWATTGATLAAELPEDLDDETKREALFEVLRHVQGAVQAVLEDDMGRKALSKYKRVRLEISARSAVTKSGDTLNVQVPLNFAQRPDARGWRDLLEAQL